MNIHKNSFNVIYLFVVIAFKSMMIYNTMNMIHLLKLQ